MSFIGNVICGAIAFCVLLACLFGPGFLALTYANVWWLAAYPFTYGLLWAIRDEA